MGVDEHQISQGLFDQMANKISTNFPKIKELGPEQTEIVKQFIREQKQRLGFGPDHQILHWASGNNEG